MSEAGSAQLLAAQQQQQLDGGDDQLDPHVEFLQQLLRDNEFLQRENLLFEAFLAKVDMSKLGSLAEEDAAKKKKAARKTALPVPSQAGGGGRGPGGGKGEGSFSALTDEEKNDLVSQEVEMVQAEIEAIKKAGDKDIDDIRTLMEEVDMRIAETKKDTYEFKRDIIIGAENPRTGKVVAEKMIRFLEDKLRQKDGTADKLRLKNTTTKALITKLEHQLAHKEEMGEVLHLVDFDQLKIENQQYMERIEERNNELLKLKLSTSRTVQVLNHLKSQLSDMVAAGHSLRRQILERKQDLARFDAEYTSVLDEKGRGERTVRRLKLEQEDIDTPTIMDYIKLKHEVSELEKQLTDWRRKIDILTMEKSRKRTLLKTVATTTLPMPHRPGPSSGGAM
ncbi:hypothetical protein VOLCADRAFT_104371 [Volvox carteri f. nagariensis]|uniref:Cilia- and flagella-associated protein 263 n=1 Tax=Volvox carteri f. nagariensis TaxID=3068 RepID=D8TTB0_VOLCA|nr:uncharacterized protein VOLCADRAFT_104371 [Volvox carteri f. nagariensis]EFJ49167.1 hypothetical protein VOLCADRAFT_104371 [Volvox carteri f. nagariensis]|eukprot:XP_002949615.1 hypothetical protein VOLCADRAFT_104371 [Volvox carteri f. nagariensis]